MIDFANEFVFNSLLAQSDNSRVVLEYLPLFPLTQWWQTALFGLVVILLIGFVIWMYRRDGRELPRGRVVLLTTLRVLAFAALIVFLLHPQKRMETRMVKDSKVAVLVDTSLSMGLRDTIDPSAPRRIDSVIATLKSGELIEQLRTQHDVNVYRFADFSQPELVATFEKETEEPREEATLPEVDSLALSSSIGWGGIAFFVAFVIFGASYLAVLGSPPVSDRAAWIQTASVLCLMVSLIVFALCDLAAPRYDLWTSLGWTDKPDTMEALPEAQSPAVNNEHLVESEVDWEQALIPTGTSTQVGSAIQFVVNKERGGSLAGILLATDGRSNTGPTPARAAELANNEGVPIYPIGVGTTETAKNVEVSNIQAPSQVFPGDKFQVEGLVQGYGLSDISVRVQLFSVDDKEREAETVEGETTIKLSADGQPASIKFDLQGQEQGKRRYTMRIVEVNGDQDPHDNQRSVMVEIVDRKTVVLLIAGGPMRDFRFLRNQLYRDKDVTLHVWLQNAKTGADQESDKLLFEFPKTREEMFQYDCVIAFDPDWRKLDSEQADWFERWVAEKAGGLIVVAGPVFTPEWTRQPRGNDTIDKIRKLYPVSFYNQGSAVLKLGRFGGEQAFPLDFTRVGRTSEFLWLGESASESAANWAQFDGVFGYYAVNEAKQGADVLSYFADPSTSIDNRLPIYMANQFYGAGRVFFQASGESWRTRRINVDYFEEYYTKLIRWASQGRLLRDSTRGVLLTDRQRYWMGDQVSVQAILRDAQDEPLIAERVSASVLKPDGTTQRIELTSLKDAVRPGSFRGRFTAGVQGNYRISLPIPDSPDLETLTTEVQSDIPDLEKEQPERNDAVLAELAERTLGHYYVGTGSLTVDPSDPLFPTQLIQPQDQITFLPGTPDRFFNRRLMMWLLGLITTALCIEWTLRRLNRLV